MERLKIASLVTGCFLLANCSSTSPAQITENARQIQGYTKLFCSFVPTIGTIASILSSGTSAPFALIAKDICDAVTTAPLADGKGRKAKVYGVEIKGSFVK